MFREILNEQFKLIDIIKEVQILNNQTTYLKDTIICMLHISMAGTVHSGMPVRIQIYKSQNLN